MPLADMQATMRDVVVRGRALDAAFVSMLTGGGSPADRLLLHRRHYVSSLVQAVRTRFPCVEWAAGADVMIDVAQAFVQQMPPRRPCIAEYGESFPAFVDSMHGGTMPWLHDLARVEWFVGRAAVSVSQPAVTLPQLQQSLRTHAGHDGRLFCTLQPSVVLLTVAWDVDALFTHFLTADDPVAWAPLPLAGTLVVSGARGECAVERLAPAHAAFMRAVRDGLSLDIAMDHAMESHDAGTAEQILAFPFQREWIASVHTLPIPFR